MFVIHKKERFTYFLSKNLIAYIRIKHLYMLDDEKSTLKRLHKTF